VPILNTSTGTVIAYDVTGDDAAPPIVLIQGLSAQLLGWHPDFRDSLAGAGFRVIRFDNRDVGQSQKYPQGGYTLLDMVADVADLLDGLSLDRAHIVGQSMGGMIAQLLAISRPERVASLGLLYTAADLRHAIGQESIDARRTVSPPQSRDEYISWYVAGEAACASRDYPQDTAWLAELGGQMWDRDPLTDGAFRQLAAILETPPWADGLPGIAVPTVIAAGDSDGLIDPAASFELRRLIPRSRLSIIPGMGHELPRERWPELVELLAANARRASDHTGTATRPEVAS
jgi:pimeloyl-ACP methyl ester carboxylesterase